VQSLVDRANRLGRLFDQRQCGPDRSISATFRNCGIGRAAETLAQFLDMLDECRECSIKGICTAMA
jgi:hypothetical protein